MQCLECFRVFKNKRALAIHAAYHRPEVASRQSKSQKEAQNRPEVREKRVASILNAYSNPEKKERHRVATTITNQDADKRSKVSAGMKNYFSNNPEKLEEFLLTSKSAGGKLTKLHQRMRSVLGMDELGFISEQHVNNRMVDELHIDKKVIVEFYGNHVHADPNKFEAGDIIAGYGYTAKQKWENDAKRTKELEEAGYKVIIVWSFDDIDDAKSRILYVL